MVVGSQPRHTTPAEDMLARLLLLCALLGGGMASSDPSGTPIADCGVDAYRGANATLLRNHALQLLRAEPLIDTHMDMPQILRELCE